MKEVPILFSTPMVQAILDGRKTQTRRILNPQPSDSWMDNVRKITPNGRMFDRNGQIFWISDGADGEIKPKAKPGHLLWVRETHIETPGGKFHYKADISDEKDSNRKGYIDIGESWAKWKPSIHMRKGGARIWLRVTDVRVERLNEISEEDAFDEGCEERYHRCSGMGYYEAGGDTHECKCMAWDREPVVMGYADLWESINGEGSWALNPWVWVYTFEVVSKTGKPSIHETEIKK